MTDDSGKKPLSSFSTRRPVAVLVVCLAAGVFGFFAVGRLPVNLMPELSYPTLTVRTEYPGSAPEEVENDISRPLEEALGVIGGLQRISSVSRAGVSDVVLEFAWDADMSEATQDTLERMDQVFLPEESKQPLILQYDPSLDPVMELSLSGQGGGFAGEEGLRRLRRLAELQVKRELEPIRGVAAVRIRGGLEEEIQVEVDENLLRRAGLSAETVILRLQQENINLAGGTIQEGRTEYMVRTLNEYQNLGQIEDTILARVDGRDIRVRDVGRVIFGHKERQILTRTDGGESVQIEILKEADANMVALAKRVKTAVGELDLEEEKERSEGKTEAKSQSPFAKWKQEQGKREPETLATRLYRSEGVVLTLVSDRSTFIESSIQEVISTALQGGLLAVLVLFLFLRNARSTAIVAVSIPISVLITFAPLHFFGVTLNVMSLGGLALGIGMLVDSSIVVLESIFRCREEGDDLVTAAVRGTREVQGAVGASTLTSIAVFFPMVLVEGVAGQAFGDLGMAVVVSLLASLAVAVYFIPMLASREGKGFAAAGNKSEGWKTKELLRRDWQRLGGWRWIALPYLAVRTLLGLVFGFFGKLMGLVWLAAFGALRFLVPLLVGGVKVLFALPLRWTGQLLNWTQESYPKALALALRHGGLVLAGAVGILVLTVYSAMQLDSELLPEVHQGELTVEVGLPVGTPLEETEAILAPVERAILDERDLIEALVVTYGFDPVTSQRSDQGEHSVNFKLVVERPSAGVMGRILGSLGRRSPEDYDLKAREDAVIRRIRGKLAQVPDLDARVKRPVLFSFRTPIEVEIHGTDLKRLKTIAAEARDLMAGLPELADVETTLRSGAPEVQIVYDRDRLARYGLNIQQVAQLVRDQVKGFEATRFNLVDRRVPVVVRLLEADRETVEDVRDLVVNPGSGRPIPLSAVATAELGEGPSEVRRVDGQRVALVQANLSGAALGTAVERIEEVLARRIDWPADMTFLVAGQNLEWQRSQRSLLLALGLSIFLVYVIMAAQFESLLQPLVIMATIPLAFFGTMVTLWALDIHLSIVVFLGMIMLAGIVVNNAIVLVDYINKLRGRGLPVEEAILTAGRVRLRPILMTTATTALGLAPMAVGLGDGAEIRTPMAIAVISGLVASTALTLFIIPVVFARLEGLRARLFGTDEGEAEGSSQPGDRVSDPGVAGQVGRPALDPEGAMS